jgi:hypothetical protein
MDVHMTAQIIYGKATEPFFCGICVEEHKIGTLFGGHIAVEGTHEHAEVAHLFCSRAFKRYLNTEEQRHNPTCPLCRAKLEHNIWVWIGNGGILRSLRAVLERFLRGNEIVAAALRL